MIVSRPAAALALLALASRVKAADCPSLRERYVALLATPFSVERDLTFRINGEVRAREVSLLTWNGRNLEKRLVSKEPRKATVDVTGDPITSLRFACEGWGESDGGELAFHSPEGETIVFRTDPAGGLIPLRWEETQTVKVLFARRKVVATASFAKFSRP